MYWNGPGCNGNALDLGIMGPGYNGRALVNKIFNV